MIPLLVAAPSTSISTNASIGNEALTRRAVVCRLIGPKRDQTKAAVDVISRAARVVPLRCRYGKGRQRPFESTAALHTVHVLGRGREDAIDEMRLLTSTAPSPSETSVNTPRLSHDMGIRTGYRTGASGRNGHIIRHQLDRSKTSATGARRTLYWCECSTVLTRHGMYDTTRIKSHIHGDACASKVVIPKDSGTVLQHVRVPTSQNSSSVLLWSSKVVVCRRQGASKHSSKWLDWRLPLFH